MDENKLQVEKLKTLKQFNVDPTSYLLSTLPTPNEVMHISRQKTGAQASKEALCDPVNFHIHN